MDALDQYIEEARGLSEAAQSNGDRNHGAHFAVGVGAILAGVAAAGLGFADAPRVVTGLGGVLAAVLAGVQTLFTFEDKARYHYAKVAEYAGIRRHCIALKERSERPTYDELAAIGQRLTAIQARAFHAAARRATDAE